MAQFQIRKATKTRSYARIGLIGYAGSGKTWTALEIGKGIGGKFIMIDTESGSSEKYSDYFDFEVIELPNHSPATYTEAIKFAEKQGANVIGIDSLSHAWMVLSE